MLFRKFAIAMAVLFVCSCNHFYSSSSRVNHVVLCWLKDSGNLAQRKALIEASLKFKDIPGVLEVRAGEVIKSNRAIVDSTYDVAIFLSYASVEDLKAYIVHPDHKVAVDTVLKPLVKKVLVYDFIEAP